MQMVNKLSGWEDTIAAMATPPGIGAIGLIRLSGAQAIEIAGTLFPSRDLANASSHTLHVGMLRDAGEDIDQVVISLFRAPHSYTGEDVIEISCHGSPYIHQRVMEACTRRGARIAKPGEYTQRAFMNGKLDLAQAEAVADLVASNSAASQRTALNNVRGGFSAILKGLREQLIGFSALVELELDFSQEDVEFADRHKFYELVSSAMTTTAGLIASFQLGNIIKNGVSVAIIGKPNAGKSTLLNTLLNESRAIVSEIPGTTRDTIEELVNINGILFRLIDTAGIRQHSTDLIELVGIEKSLEKMRSADVVLYIFDVSETTKAELETISQQFMQESRLLLLVGNKVDTIHDAQRLHERLGKDIFLISAKHQTGIAEIKEALFRSTVREQPITENVVVSNARHYAALNEVARSLGDIQAGLDNSLPADLLALDIRRCLHYLSEITGDISNENVLEVIFSKFCIGK